MTIVTKTNKEHWLDNLKMAQIVLDDETKELKDSIYALKDCIEQCDETKLVRMYEKIDMATRLIYEAKNMTLMED